MSEVTSQSATPGRSHSRYILNPGADPSIEVRLSLADPNRRGMPISVSVRCGQCDKRLYDVEVGQYYHGEYGMLDDGTLVVTRKCRHCRGLNKGQVTASPGQPLADSDALDGPWHCIHCSWSLGKVDEIRGRIVTTCKCGHEARVVAADAIAAAS